MKTTLRNYFICISFLLSWHLVDAQISVIEVINDCQANCKGEIAWRLVVKQSPALVTLLKDGQAYKTPQTYNPGQHYIEHKQLCKGTYTLQVQPKGFASCGISSEPVNITEESFDFDIYRYHSSGGVEKVTFSFSQEGTYGMLKAFNENGPFVSGGGGTNAIEMSGFDLLQHDGVFYVRAINGNCQVTKRFKLDCVEDVTANIGVEPVVGDPSKVKLKALVFDADLRLIDLNQTKIALTWWGEALGVNPLGSGAEIIVSKDRLGSINGVLVATLEVSTTCIEGSINERKARGQIVTKIIDCQEIGNLSAAFVKRIDPFCAVGKKGTIIFDYHWEDILIKINGQRLLPAGSKLVDNLQPGPYEIEIEGCSSFLVTVPEKKSTLKFARLKKENDEPSICVYNAKCEGDAQDVMKEYPVKFDFSDVTGASLCAVPVYCDYDGFRRDFGLRSFGAEKKIAGIYTRILEGEKATTTNPARLAFLDEELRRVKNVPGCAIVKYCPTTLERISTDGASIAQNPGIFCEGDCEFLDCTFLFGTAGKIHDACAEAPNYMADTRNCCGPGGKRIDIPLGQLAYTYFSLSPEELEQLYLTVPQFEDSQLEKTLKTHIAPLFDGLSPSEFMEAFTRDPRLACAHAFVCTDDFKLVDLDDPNVLVPNLLDGVKDCGEDVLALPWSITDSEGKDKHASKKTKTCALHPDFINTRPFRSETSNSLTYLDESDGKQLRGVFTCGATIYKPFIGKKRLVGDDNVEIWNGIGLFSQLIPSDPFTQPENRLASSFTEEEQRFQQKGLGLRFKIFTDTVSPQSILRFTTIKATGQFVPKLMFEEAGENNYYNYSHNIPVIEKIDMKNVEFLYEDWDDDKTFALLKSIPQKEYIISTQDTSNIIALAMSSDSLLKVSHFSKAENSIFIGGYYYGNLFIGGEAFDSIPDYQKASAFLGRISLQGEIQNITIIENIDTVGGLLFSENQAGATIIATQVIGNKLRINGEDSTLLSENCLIIGKYDLIDGFQLLSQSSGHTGFKIAAVSASIDNQELAVATFGNGGITKVNNRPVFSSGHNLNIMRFNSEGDYVDAIFCPSNNINVKKIGLTYGAENALALGITYKNTIQIFDTTLTSLGQEDVAILKFSAEGNVRWIKDYGTEDQESLSQLFYNKNNVIYFAGEMSGDTAETHRLGEYIFYDTTGLATQRVYLSYVRDTLFTSNIPEIATEINPQISNRKLTSRNHLQALNVQPNPFTDQTTVIYTTTEAGHYTLAVQDELGRVIMQQSWELNVGQQSHVLSTSQLTPGFYYLTLRNANGKIVGAQKLIKQ